MPEGWPLGHWLPLSSCDPARLFHSLFPKGMQASPQFKGGSGDEPETQTYPALSHLLTSCESHLSIGVARLESGSPVVGLSNLQTCLDLKAHHAGLGEMI